MSLTDAQRAARENKLTASRVGILMSGDAGKIINLWREMIGDPAFVPEDLSSVWPVALGSHTESLHLNWLESQKGYQLSRRGESVNHSELAWAACTLDAWSVPHSGPVEAKHVGAFVKPEEIRSRTFAQLHWQKLCTKSAQGILSVIFGANEPVQELIAFDAAYATELMSRAKAFWHCVETLTPPCALPSVAAPGAPAKFRTINIPALIAANEALPNWASDMESQGEIWLKTVAEKKKNEDATTKIKELLPDDVGKFDGWGISISRSKGNKVTIKKEK
jgi:hypothetical protein